MDSADDNSTDDGSSAEVVEATKADGTTRKAAARNKAIAWLPIEKEVNGKKTFPFLDPSNMKDILLARTLIVHNPYSSTHGSKVKIWEDVKSLLEKEADVFPFISNIKTIRSRAGKLLEWAKAQSDGAPFRSGEDDEAPDGELVQALEDILELKMAAEEEKDKKTKAGATALKNMRQEADLLKMSALNHSLGSAALRKYLDPNSEDEAAAGTSKKKQKRGSSSGRTISPMTTPGAEYSSAMDKHWELKKERQAEELAMKKKKQDVELEIRRKKIEMREKEREERREERRANKQAAREAAKDKREERRINLEVQKQMLELLKQMTKDKK